MSRDLVGFTAHARRAPRRSRGYTLVEMLIAMSAGLMVTAAAFLLAKNASRVFQYEARISAAQLGATLGMNRLQADLQRAGFMSTANITKDPSVCGPILSPAGLTSLAGIRVASQGSYLGAPDKAKAQLDANGLTPDSLVIGGSLSTTEQFPVRAITTGPTGGLDVYLQTNSGPMVRTLANSETDATATLNSVFGAGRFLRFVDALGRQEFGQIASVAIDDPALPKQIIVRLTATPTPTQKSPTNSCGYSGLGVGVLVNPVVRVQYRLASLQGDPTFGALVAPLSQESNEVTGDDGRLELVRTELDPNGAEIDATRELVAEFAVDLKVGLTMATTGPAPAISRLPMPMTDAQYALVGDVSLAGNVATPERVRAVQVRLATRARAPDRDVDLDPGDDGRRYRFLIPGVPPPSYARLRTLYADVALPNQAGLTW